jgi:hypothetical protein
VLNEGLWSAKACSLGEPGVTELVTRAVLDLPGDQRCTRVDRSPCLSKRALDREQLIIAEWAHRRDIPRHPEANLPSMTRQHRAIL